MDLFIPIILVLRHHMDAQIDAVVHVYVDEYISLQNF